MYRPKRGPTILINITTSDWSWLIRCRCHGRLLAGQQRVHTQESSSLHAAAPELNDAQIRGGIAPLRGGGAQLRWAPPYFHHWVSPSPAQKHQRWVSYDELVLCLYLFLLFCDIFNKLITRNSLINHFFWLCNQRIFDGLQLEIEQFLVENLNEHRKGLLGKTVPIGNMLTWTKASQLSCC